MPKNLMKIYDGSQSTTYFRDSKKKGEEIRADFLKIDFLADLIANDGISSYNNRRYDWYDVFHGRDRKLLDSATISSTALMKFFPQSVEILLRSEIEPKLWIAAELFDQMSAPDPGDSVKIGAIGALEAYRIAEGQEYKPMHPDIDGGDMVNVQIAKWGGKIGFTLEGQENDKWGLLSLWLKKAGAALARIKEKTVMRLMQEMGYTFIDNVTPTSSIAGVSTGRGIDGNQNGTLTLNDLLMMYGHMWFQGYEPTHMIMHPFTWMMFATDPEMREVINSGTISYERPGARYEYLPAGGGGNQFENNHGKLGLTYTGGRGVGLQSNELSTLGRLGAHPHAWGLNPFGATYNIKPKGLPTALTVMVTPYIYSKRIGTTPTDPDYEAAGMSPSAKFLTDIIMVDSNATGVVVTKESPTTESWEDIERERYYTKIRERWGAAIYEQGRGVCIARNLLVDRNYVFDNVNNVELSPIDRWSDVVSTRP